MSPRGGGYRGAFFFQRSNEVEVWKERNWVVSGEGEKEEELCESSRERERR